MQGIARLLLTVCTLITASSAYAGLIQYTNESDFNSALLAPLTFEGFNDNELSDVSVESGFIRYRTTSSLVSEGEKALVLKEKNTVTFHFDHEVFALSFFVNELNSTNLSYTDSGGNELIDVFKVTDIWNASTFFGITSDIGLTSFTLSGSGTSNALYGIDAMRFTAPTNVPEPAPIALFALCILGLLVNKRRSKHQ